MAGVFFELFVFMTLLVVGLVLGSVFSRKVWPILLASVFLVLTGAALLSDGIRYETGSVYDAEAGVTTYNYDVLTASNDATVSIFSNAYFYGGFLLAVAGLGYLFKTREG